jgi:hypothetical protein
MIAMRMHDEEGNICVILVLEPGNLEKLKAGQPIHKWLNEFIPELPRKVELLFTYSPDVMWVAEQLKDASGDVLKMAEIIESSLTREPVVVRDRTAEEMKKVF